MEFFDKNFKLCLNAKKCIRNNFKTITPSVEYCIRNIDVTYCLTKKHDSDGYGNYEIHKMCLTISINDANIKYKIYHQLYKDDNCDNYDYSINGLGIVYFNGVIMQDNNFVKIERKFDGGFDEYLECVFEHCYVLNCQCQTSEQFTK